MDDVSPWPAGTAVAKANNAERRLAASEQGSAQLRMENARLRQQLGDKTALLRTISEVSAVLSGAQHMLLKRVQSCRLQRSTRRAAQWLVLSSCVQLHVPSLRPYCLTAASP